MRIRIAKLLCLILLFAGGAAGDDDAPDDDRRPHYSLLPLPDVDVGPGEKPSAAEADAIRKLIRELADIDRPGWGFDPQSGSSEYLRTPESSYDLWGIAANQYEQPAAFRKLIALGPQAMPFLLEALDDATPTKLRVNHEPIRIGDGTGKFALYVHQGGMWFGHEVPWNPVNQAESRVLTGVDLEVERDCPSYEHRVTVGDLCFVVLGAITNRDYSAVRSQMTNCIVVNSPVADPPIAREVRAVWGGSDHRRKLFRSLLVDFCSRGDDSFDLQRGAAMRLAYYFPEEAGGIVAERLRGPDASSLVEAVARCPERRIRREAVEVFTRTTDTYVLLAALPAVVDGHRDLAFQRLSEFADKIPTMGDTPGRKHYWESMEGFELLPAIIDSFPVKAEAVLRRFLEPDTIQRRVIVCEVLQQRSKKLSQALLVPMLNDERLVSRRSVLRQYGWRDRPLPVRVCDCAAISLASNFEDIDFDIRLTLDEVDAEIEAIRKRFAASKNAPGQ